MARKTNRSLLLDHINKGDTFVYDKYYPKHYAIKDDKGYIWLSVGLNAELRKMIKEGLVNEPTEFYA